MKELLNTLKGLPWIIRIILCIPALDIVWCVARVLNGIVKNNIVYIIIGILSIVPGAVFFWVIDLILVLLGKQPLLVD